VAAGKEKRKHARVRPRGVVAHVRAATASFACQVENLSAGGLFLRTDQQLARGTPLELDLVKPGGRKTLHLAAAVAGVITPEEAVNAHLIPGLGVQFVELGDEEAKRLEELLTALGVEPQQAVVAPELRRRRPAEAESTSEIPLSATPAKKTGMDAETILRDIREELEGEDTPLPTSKPALPPRPKAPPSPASEPLVSEAAKMMTQIRGLIYELAEVRALLREREAESLDLRAQLDDARAQIEELERTTGSERDLRRQ
jgi:uncharacterized protein (TIGR02266 family)